MKTYYERIKFYWSQGYWTKDQVKKAVEMNAITKEEYFDIIGEEYVA